LASFYETVWQSLHDLDAVMAPRPEPLATDGGCPPYDD